ncbi:hypothetical protein F1559_004750 [Cyanidiococcus yangmingshanensis]|uniref:Uncharacterized protein n=1 Tax=Cyanidiococcus yangmingshanensis TaxID=2690220 RepID=A0A7J7IQZ5_9RHOD|nr:hypothetical protein F1559_004750 [Cyanidiococcus yangmingshanensis]
MPTTGDWRNWTEADKVAASLEELAAHEPMGVELLQKALAADHTVSRLHAYAEGSIFLERLHGRTMARYLRDRLRLLSLFETPERILEIANVVYSSHPRSFHEGQKLFQKLMLELLTQYVLLDGLENMHGEERLVLDSRPLRELVQEDPSYGSGLAQQRLHELESIFVDAKHLGPKRDGQDQQPNSAKISESFSAQYRKLVASRFPTERIVSIVEAYTNALLEWLGEPPLSAMIAELDRIVSGHRGFLDERETLVITCPTASWR